MSRKSRRSHIQYAGALALLALISAPCPARAQWGMGMGMGWGWGWGGMGYHAPSPTAFLNQQAIARSAAGRQPRPSFSPYSNNSNAYFNHIRDNGLVSHYDVREHRAPSYAMRSAPVRERARARPAAAATSGAPAAAPRPILPLSSFFDASYKLVWPNESPIDGDLKTKRDISDQASLAVLNEVKKSGSAAIGEVTTARQKLLDYGRPALKQVREHTTPRIADTFHLFLLALYDSLAQAATPPTPAPDAPPVPPAP